MLLINIVRSRTAGAVAGPNPWDAPTLEWSVSSPPPPYNFAIIPVIASRHPLWEDRLDETTDRSTVHGGFVLDEGKETVGVTALDAEPDVILKMPGDSLLPLLAALGMTVIFCGMLLINYLGDGGRRCLDRVGASAFGWRLAITRARKGRQSMADIHLSEISLPVGGQEQISTRWWGMMCLIATEGILFVYLIFAYAYLGSQSPGPWPPAGPPSLALSAPDTVVLLASSFLLGWGVRKGASKARLQLALAGTFVLGAVFLVVQGFEWAAKPFTLKTNAYSAIYFTLTGFHMAHVVVGLLMLLVLLGWSVSGRLNHHPECAFLGTLYWHFVDVVWLAVFTAIYLVPRFS